MHCHRNTSAGVALRPTQLDHRRRARRVRRSDNGDSAFNTRNPLAEGSCKEITALSPKSQLGVALRPGAAAIIQLTSLG